MGHGGPVSLGPHGRGAGGPIPWGTLMVGQVGWVIGQFVTFIFKNQNHFLRLDSVFALAFLFLFLVYSNWSTGSSFCRDEFMLGPA